MIREIKQTLRILPLSCMCVLGMNNAFAFDLDTGVALIEVALPNIVPLLAEDVSISGADATLVLRHTTLLSNAWFDAVAPYHPTQVGVYSHIPVRHTEATFRGKNIAVLYSTHRVLSSLAPHRQAQWDAMLEDVGLDPNDNSMDTNTAVGIGNVAGYGIVNARVRDGMNQLGDEGGVIYNRKPYKDYTGYVPANSFYELLDPSRWQPAAGTNGFGKFVVQQYVTPQMALVKPYSFKKPASFNVEPPRKSDFRNYSAYKKQVDIVLEISANLTDEQKLIAELFDYKLRSLGDSTEFAIIQNQLGYIEAIQLDFLANVAAFDASIAVWHQKTKYDAVRPWTAISYVYGDQKVTAWGGPGMGTVSDLPANQWTSYLPVADHPEYPSGSAAFCAAHAYVMQKWFNSDELNWSVSIPKGASTYERGFTPQYDTQLYFSTWSKLKEECGNSRLYGGVHFPDSIAAGFSIGDRVGKRAHKFVQRHIEGKR